jgi:type IV pilus assembly protein PilO
MPIETVLEGKPIWWGLGIGLGAGLLIVFGVHWYFVSNTGAINDQIAQASSEMDTLNVTIEKGRAAERKLPQFREQVQELERQLEKLRRILPSSRNTEEIIKKIKALVDQGDFDFKSLKFPDLPETASGDVPIVEWPISVAVSGNYHDLAILFNRLSNFTRIMNVDQFTITARSQQETRTIESEFIAKTFVYIEPKEAPAEKKPGPKPAAPGGGGEGGVE